MLYSYRNQYPATIPDRIRLPNGDTRTGLDTLNLKELQALGFQAVSNPPEVPYTSKVEWLETNWIVREKTSQELEMEQQVLVESLKIQRNRLLLESDWTQLPDAPTDKPAWAAYRQQLRDISLQPEYPYQVTWPQAPV